ncbi:hypothetical protein AMJ49_04635 [Parcubacteria bacterium DG_74_2]|nr:MAG: hypothetical protein AMJ49_04635 [Parcubacteria bacterium DG_74_2]
MAKNKYKAIPKLEGYYYSFKEAKEARDTGKILTIRIETSRICNLRCNYCCNRSGKPLKNELSYTKLKKLIKEAKELGAKSVIVIGGGEPTIYPKFKNIIKYIYELNMMSVLFTNSQTMSKSLTKFLYQYNVSVITKLDSLNEETQDTIAGVRGTFKNIQKGIRNLLDVGYKDWAKKGKYKLGASFVVNKINAREIPSIWRFCRENYIFPNLEMIIPNGVAKKEQKLLLKRNEWRQLKQKLLKIDRKEYNYNWFPYAPLGGIGCFQVMYNLYISIDGNVRPCSSIHCHVANVKNMSLKEIINLPFFNIARNIEKHLKGKCGRCKNHFKCIGCRGLAFSVNKNKGRSEIESLCSEDPSCSLKNS